MHRRQATALLLLGSAQSVSSQTQTNQNQALSDLAHLFFEDGDFFGHRLLERSKLDFSLASLDHVNEYLGQVRVSPGVKAQWNRLVLRTGAYVGEVIRKNDKQARWRWLDYAGAKSVDPKSFEAFGKSIGTAAVLNDGKSGFAFPLAKVEKYLENGAEDNLRSFAQVILSLP